MAEQTSGLFWRESYREAVEPELSPLEQKLREQFVEQYLMDYDAHLACIRLGFNSQFAQQYATQFMQEPLVQRLIAEHERSAEGDTDISKQDRARILATLRRAMQNGMYASRVAAAGKLMTLYGLDKPTSADDDKEALLINALKDFAQKAPQ